MKLALPLLFLAFNSSLYADEKLVDAKAGCRQGIINRSPVNVEKFFSPITGNDRAENLIDEPYRMVKNLQQMEESKLLAGQSKQIPWSDSYWPLSKGGLGQRYNDGKFDGYDWKVAADYITQNPAMALVGRGEADKLSPAEKYDWLFGLKKFPLTHSSWSDGKTYFDQYGNVEGWMGLCHGWAAASMMMSEPLKKIELKTSSGSATLFPSDIKGLGTLLWAKGDFETRFIGGRCNDKDPVRDAAGRTVDQECLDNNPGTWHLTVINQLGVSRRPFIMDASFDYEVWNQPVFSYSYKYYHPISKQKVPSMGQAIVKKGDWTDPRSKYRARDAQYIVGIIMTVTYAVENSPSTEENQEKHNVSVDYKYDLELDKDKNIIGGEWYSNKHPDFLWLPAKESFPETYGDIGQELGDLNPSAEIRSLVSSNAARGLPWGPIVRELYRKSSY